MKKIISAVMLLLGLSIFNSCDEIGNGDAGSQLIGTWESQGGMGDVHSSISTLEITSSTITMNFINGSELFQLYGSRKTVNYSIGEPYKEGSTVFQKLILDEPLFKTEKELLFTIERKELTIYTISFDVNLFFSKK